ncbi:MAG: hypothetical protein CO108_29455 [Deltaproteobacteria bacterium CG_4_9_14_3_um_filter_63_12]|nr:MAG: hypothetical protein CO108_29455 [Deltaproteobacteria bacterium CG_4_9_14_3_um_filter_63_12]
MSDRSKNPPGLSGPADAKARMLAARAALETAGHPHCSEVLAFWARLEEGAGDLTSFEESVVDEQTDDVDQAISSKMRVRSGHSSVFSWLLTRLDGKVDEAWAEFFEAAVEYGADADEEDMTAIPGAIYGLGLAYGDFSRTFDFVQGQACELGRRRRLELAMVANRFFDQGEAPRDFLVEEAQRFAARFAQYNVDTSLFPLWTLVERGDSRGGEIASNLLSGTSFSGPNWRTALALVGKCGEVKLQSAAPGLYSALRSRLGRHDDGDRATVIRAYAACEPVQGAAARILSSDLADKHVVGSECERAAHLAALLDLEPENEKWSEQAKACVGRLIENMGSSEFGSSTSLLQSMVDNKVPGIEAMGQAVLAYGKTDSYSKSSLLAWLTATFGGETS